MGGVLEKEPSQESGKDDEEQGEFRALSDAEDRQGL